MGRCSTAAEYSNRVHAGGRMRTHDLLKQLIRKRLPVTTDHMPHRLTSAQSAA